MSNVIELGEYRFTHKARTYFDRTQCQHKHTELDDNGNIVMCLDCGKQVDAYFILRLITQDWGKIQEKIRATESRVNEEKGKHIHLIAARKVEQAWRDRLHVPTCPHCGEGISPTDGFGGGRISKQIDDARRNHRAAQRAQARKGQDA
ncbi:hypothetical protein LZ683_08665 [Comamonas testosteroni]|uniref:hypothetical protein n=1 Tax=Comamonas testosteroni TaxID=285 RepID=UPI0023AA709D|nr:hypothetical protein [Comamonas testosteroni]WEE79413.1 hypothetical protein LZ683_08665 [Comamonas testosteroni]